MKPTITYREITLAIGILVALLVAFSLWANSSFTINSDPSMSFHSWKSASLNLIETVTRILF